MKTSRRSLLFILVTLALATLVSGCLSDSYTIPDNELERLVSVPPDQRGQRVRVVQRLGNASDPETNGTQPSSSSTVTYHHCHSHGVHVGQRVVSTTRIRTVHVGSPRSVVAGGKGTVRAAAPSSPSGRGTVTAAKPGTIKAADGARPPSPRAAAGAPRDVPTESGGKPASSGSKSSGSKSSGSGGGMSFDRIEYIVI